MRVRDYRECRYSATHSTKTGLLWRLTSLMLYVHWIACNQLIVHNSTNDESYSCNVGIYTTWWKHCTGVWRPYMKSKQSVWGRNKSRNWRIKLLTEIPENRKRIQSKKIHIDHGYLHFRVILICVFQRRRMSRHDVQGTSCKQGNDRRTTYSGVWSCIVQVGVAWCAIWSLIVCPSI